MSTIISQKITTRASENWQKSEDVITHNDVIDAYLRGKEVGKDETRKATIKMFHENLLKAQENSEKLGEALKENNINISEIHLKADSITDFMALVITTPEDFADEKFLKAISLGREIKNYVMSEDFTLHFFFTYKGDTLQEHCLNADGYFLKYYANA